MRQKMLVAGAFAAAVALAGAFALAGAADPPMVDPPGEPRLLRAGPLVGYGGHDAATIWADAPAPGAKLEVVLAPVGATSTAGAAAAERRIAIPPAAAGHVARAVRIDGLRPATRYAYRVLVDGKADPTSEGSFATGPEPGKPLRAKIAVVSCMHAKRHPEQVAWRPLLESKPDLLLHLGDNIYANSTDPDTIRAWYTAQRRIPEYAAVLRAMPVLSIWDDHDFGANDGDGTLPGKERSLATFRELWPNPSSGATETPGVFLSAALGDVDLFLLDTRYHRAPNWATDDDSKRMIGDAQFAWLERGLAASRAAFKLVASGSTINAGPKDSWRLYTKDRKRLLGLTRTVNGILFLSGDIHTSLLGRLEAGELGGYPLYEVISSGVAVNRSLHFFTTIDVDTTQDDPTMVIRIHKVSPEGKVVGVDERVIRRSELRPAF